MSSEEIQIELQELKPPETSGVNQNTSNQSKINKKSTASTPTGANAMKIFLFTSLGFLILSSAIFGVYFWTSSIKNDQISKNQTTTDPETTESSFKDDSFDYDEDSEEENTSTMSQNPSILKSSDEEYDDEYDDTFSDHNKLDPIDKSNFCKKLLKIPLERKLTKMICIVESSQIYSEASSVCTNGFMTPLNITAGIKEKVFDFLKSNYSEGGETAFWIRQSSLNSCQVVKIFGNSQEIKIENDFCNEKHFVLCEVDKK